MQFWDQKVIMLMQDIEKFIKLIKKDKELRHYTKELKMNNEYKTYKEKYNEAKETAKLQKAWSDIAYRNWIAKKIQLKFLDQVAVIYHKKQLDSLKIITWLEYYP